MDHIHVSAMDCVVTAAVVVVTLYGLRLAAVQLSASDNPTIATIGQGLAFDIG